MIKDFLDAFRQQLHLTSALSGAGLAAIIFAWSHFFGVGATADMTNFRAQWFLTIPGVFLLLALVAGYGVSALITGYYYEAVQKHNFAAGTSITDVEAYFRSEYLPWFYRLGTAQLGLGVLGMVLVAGWFVWNVWVK